MASEGDAVSLLATEIDRAPLDTYSATKSHQKDGRLNENPNRNDGKSESSSEDHQTTVRTKIRHVTNKLQSKLHAKHREGPLVHGNQRVLDDPRQAPLLAPPASTARDDDHLFKTPPEKPSGPSLKEVTAHPLKTLKSAAGRQGGNAYAENLAKTDVTHGANVNIVRAHENLAGTTTVTERESAIQDLEQLKKSRQDSFVRWTMDRHVQKVRRVEAIKLPRRAKEEFVNRVDNGKDSMRWADYGQYVRTLEALQQFFAITFDCISSWCEGVFSYLAHFFVQLLHFYLELYGAQYLGVFDQLPKPTESAIISSFERVILTSAPYQNFLMELRNISLWKQPKRSAIYATIYLILWWYDFLVGFALLGLLCMVVKRRYYHPTIEKLRRDLQRSEDTELAALSIPQLIEQHGAHGWVDPLITKVGPSVLSQTEDLANFLEVLRNFYEWRDPWRTKIALGILSLISLTIIIAPLQLLVKGFQLAAGLVVFIFAPIWNQYPQYRLLASPLKWIFWKVPTHAEWAISRLQAEAVFQSDQMRSAAAGHSSQSSPPEDKSSPPSDTTGSTAPDPERSARVVGQYHCTSRNRHGNLTVTTQSVDFKQHLTKDRSWRLRYDEIKAIQKIVGSSTISSGDDLLFIDMADQQFRTAGLSARDEVFTQIIGYSEVQWQVTA